MVLDKFITKNKIFSKTNNFLILFFCCFLLIILAGFRPLEYFLDTAEYIRITNTPEQILEIEPTFWLINSINTIFLGGEEQILFLLYAILGVSIKVYVINKNSLTPYLSLFTYISMFYILQEMTQIRAGVAIGLVFLALEDIAKKKKINFFIKMFIAILFHYSSIIMLLIYFLSAKKINIIFYIILPIVGSIIGLTTIPYEGIIFLSKFSPEFLSVKINLYLNQYENGLSRELNPFSIGNFFLLIIYYINLYLLTKYKNFDEYYILCVKLFGFGFFILFSFYFIETFAYRIINFLFFSLIFLLPNIVNYYKQKLLIILLIQIILIYMLMKNISLNLIIN